MPQIDKLKTGSFCWIELATSDQEAAKRFYTSLFGWSFRDSPMGPDAVYTMFQLAGGNVAAAYRLHPGQVEAKVPPNWMLYVAVEDADKTVQAVKDAGGQVLCDPFDVMSYGRMAVIQDPTGAVFSIWQPREHQGIQVTNEDGTLCWADLSTPDVEKAKEFYQKAFGWEIATAEHDKSGYQHIKNGEEFIGGVPPAAHRPANVPPYWLPYFLVSDCDASAGKARQLGAKFFLEPTTMENVGRMAIISDPQGAAFAIFQPMRKA